MFRVEKGRGSDDLRKCNWCEVYEGVGILLSSRFCMFVYFRDKSIVTNCRFTSLISKKDWTELLLFRK